VRGGILGGRSSVHRVRSSSPSRRGLPIGLTGARIRALSVMPTNSLITVAITRFEDLLALGLQTALEADPSISVVAHDVTPARLENMLRVHHPRVLILDIGSLRDYGEVREISTANPDTRLVLLGHGISSVESAQLLAFGASACLGTSTQVRDLRHAIHLASRGLQLQLLPTSPDVQDTEPLLTPREGDVLSMLRENRSNAQIALALGIGVETVRSHARHIYRKLGVSSRRALLAVDGAGAALAAPVNPSADRRGATPNRHEAALASSHTSGHPFARACQADPEPARSHSVRLSDPRRLQRRRPQHH
jgi:DNA-binding NarL/FixJ family response regulator